MKPKHVVALIALIAGVVVVVALLTLTGKQSGAEKRAEQTYCNQAVFNRAAAVYWGNLGRQLSVLKVKVDDTVLGHTLNRRAQIVFAYLVTAATVRNSQARVQGFWTDGCRRDRKRLPGQLRSLERQGGVSLTSP